MTKLHVVAGPTASGKTSFAIELAKKIDGEVISADSMQVYKYMDIGTAKPTIEEMDGVAHHLIDIVPPNVSFSVAEYVGLANEAIDTIVSRGKTPILVGGTGFYINAVVKMTEFVNLEDGHHEKDSKLREEYINLAAEKGNIYLHEKLQNIDAAYAKIVHPNNVKKVVRALSFYETTGNLLSAHNASQKKGEVKYDLDFCILQLPREILYNRINDRVVSMWDKGLPQEVEELLNRGYHANLQAMQGIGYKETILYLAGRVSKEDTIAVIQQNTRNYAKRQETWFRNQVKDAYIVNVADII